MIRIHNNQYKWWGRTKTKVMIRINNNQDDDYNTQQTQWWWGFTKTKMMMMMIIYNSQGIDHNTQQSWWWLEYTSIKIMMRMMERTNNKLTHRIPCQSPTSRLKSKTHTITSPVMETHIRLKYNVLPTDTKKRWKNPLKEGLPYTSSKK